MSAERNAVRRMKRKEKNNEETFCIASCNHYLFYDCFFVLWRLC